MRKYTRRKSKNRRVKTYRKLKQKIKHGGMKPYGKPAFGWPALPSAATAASTSASAPIPVPKPYGKPAFGYPVLPAPAPTLRVPTPVPPRIVPILQQPAPIPPAFGVVGYGSKNRFGKEQVLIGFKGDPRKGIPGGYPVKPEKLNGKTVMNYAISSHGSSPNIYPTTGYPYSFEVPQNTEIVFYSPHHTTLSCPNVVQSQVCNDEKEHFVYERFHPGMGCVNYVLSKDATQSWKSGAVDCTRKTRGGTRWVVFDLETFVEPTVGLKTVVNKIIEYNNINYPNTVPRIHCLFCRQAAPANIEWPIPK